MIKKIDNKSITVELDFDEYAVLCGFADIDEMMDHYDTDTEREAVVMSAERISEYVDND